MPSLNPGANSKVCAHLLISFHTLDFKGFSRIEMGGGKKRFIDYMGSQNQTLVHATLPMESSFMPEGDKR